MSTNEQNYRPLGPDEVIQDGDYCRQPTLTAWGPCIVSIGETPKEWPNLEFRRPIPAEPIVKEEALGGSEPIAIGGTSYCETCRNQIFPDDCCTCPSPSAPFGKCSSCGQPLNSNQVCELCFPAEPSIREILLRAGHQFGMSETEAYATAVVDDLLAARKEIVELRARAETAERERDEAEETMRTMVKNVEQPELKGASTLVLYFPNDSDREELINAFKEAKPNCKTIRL